MALNHPFLAAVSYVSLGSSEAGSKAMPVPESQSISLDLKCYAWLRSSSRLGLPLEKRRFRCISGPFGNFLACF